MNFGRSSHSRHVHVLVQAGDEYIPSPPQSVGRDTIPPSLGNSRYESQQCQYYSTISSTKVGNRLLVYGVFSRSGTECLVPSVAAFSWTIPDFRAGRKIHTKYDGTASVPTGAKQNRVGLNWVPTKNTNTGPSRPVPWSSTEKALEI